MGGRLARVPRVAQRVWLESLSLRRGPRSASGTRTEIRSGNPTDWDRQLERPTALRGIAGFF